MAQGMLVVRVWQKSTRRPVAGATVHLWTEVGLSAEAPTDSTGSVEVSDLASGWVGACVMADGFATTEPQWQTVGEDAVVTLHFELETAIAVEGVVLARDGDRPIPGARVEAMRGRQVSRGGRAFERAVADAQGRFRLAAVPRTSRLIDAPVLVVSHPDFATVDVVVQPAATDPGPFHVSVALPPGAAVRGTVLDTEGRPVEGAEVESHLGRQDARLLQFGGQSWIGGHGDAPLLVRPRTTRSAADGTFEIAGLERDKEHTLLAKAEGALPSEPIVVRAGDAEPARLSFRRTGAVVIRVVGPADAVSAASVSVSSARAIEAQPKGDGDWAIENIDAPSVFVHVAAPAMLDWYDSVVVTPGRTRTVRVRLQSAVHLAGVVVDDLGAPIARAKVWAEHKSFVHDDAGMRHACETDDAGRFRIDGLPAKRHRVLVATRRGERAVLRGARPPSDDVRVVAPRGATLRSRIAVSPGSKPPAELRALHAKVGRDGEVPNGIFGAWREFVGPVEGDAVALTGLPAGRARLLLLAKGFQRVERRVALRRGQVVDLGTLALVPAHSQDGRVVGPDGAGVHGAIVSLESPYSGGDREAWTTSATTDADGSFRLNELPAGRVRLTVAFSGVRYPPFEVEIPSAPPATLALPALPDFGDAGPP
jgi:hypothetical protein